MTHVRLTSVIPCHDSISGLVIQLIRVVHPLPLVNVYKSHNASHSIVLTVNNGCTHTGYALPRAISLSINELLKVLISDIVTSLITN